MKNSISTHIISGIIYLIALISIFPLFGNENRVDWFAISIYQYILLIGWSIFFVNFILVGLILNKSRLNTPWKKILRIFKISILGTIVIIAFGSIKYSIDFNNWQEKSKLERKIYEEKKELKFQSTLDSLKNEIDFDSTNSNAFYELGLTYRHEGQWKQSINNYQNAIKIDSTVSKYHSELAYSQSILKNYCEAIKHYKIAYSLDSTKEWILSDIERCLKMKEKN